MEKALFFLLIVACCGCGWSKGEKEAEAAPPDYWRAKESNDKEYRITQKETWVAPGVAKTEQGYIEALAGKWRLDSSALRRELNLWINGVIYRMMEDENELPQYQASFAIIANEFTNGMGHLQLELREDRTRIETEEPGRGKFGFSHALDTIYYKGEDGGITDRFRLLTVSPDSLVFVRYIAVSERDSTSYLRFKYIR